VNSSRRIAHVIGKIDRRCVVKVLGRQIGLAEPRAH
jgi:hypothetical protein